MSALFLFASCDNSGTKNESTNNGDNPLLTEFDTPFGVPPFDKVKTEHFLPAIEKGIEEHNAEIEAITTNAEKPTYTNTIEAFMNSGELLSKVSGIFFSYLGMNTNEDLQKIAREVSPKLSKHRDAISMNPVLFERIKEVYETVDKSTLTDEQAFLLDNMYKGFVRNGALLPEDKQTKLKEINEKLSVLTLQFDQNLLSETNSFKLVIDNKDDLAGLPESVISTAAETAIATGDSGKWVFTTQKPSMIPFLQYAENRALREKLYKGYINRGNNENDKDNKQIVSDVVKLRVERAQLLGYEDHASYRLENRMAKTPEKAYELLNQLWDKALVVAKKEAEELQQIIDKEGGDFKLASWDWWYYAEKLRKQKYDLDESEVRPYMKLENVREGIFTVANKLYGITFEQLTDIPTPHEDATAFEVKEADGSHLGVLYLDFFPRESKQGGAWCGGYREHTVKDGKEIMPIVTIVCNFTKPTGDKPSLLSMDEVSTFFHEFGHGLDGLFSKTSYPTSYIAWDFVELPSQIMEHWAFHPEVLPLYAKHYETGEVIPNELIKKIENSGYFNQGFATVEYLAASMLDLAYHTQQEVKNLDIAQFEKEYLDKIGLIPEIVSRYRSTYFGHIMGGYDSGYYSYIWAGVLDNDAFEAFKEKGIFNKEVAKSFRENVLAKNGIEDALKMYVDFRGSEPSIDPLLKNRGLN